MFLLSSLGTIAAVKGESATAAAAEAEYPGSTKVAAEVVSMAAEGVDDQFEDGKMRAEVSCLG